jgi:3D (Asp-Asp-Asp) domain-containing protein
MISNGLHPWLLACGALLAAASPAHGDAPTAESRPPIITATVRTTAYTHSEADHLKYGNKTALGTVLRYTPEYHSVAADWSRFPLGTKFKIKGFDRLFVVDDYGRALVGTRTIDIYFPTKERMNNWGARVVNIEILELGSFHESRKILAERAKNRYCREMLATMTTDDWWKVYNR